MGKKLNTILLVDDDGPTNVFNEYIIIRARCAEEVVSRTSGEAALQYLKSNENGGFPKPDLIFLDINMPAMNGWEFLEEYKKLTVQQRASIVIVMLTTSMNPDDAHRAKSYEDVSGYEHKPLTPKMLEVIIERHF